MSLVATPAVVLRTYRYSQTSQVVRLATRDCRVQSAIAKGALRPPSPLGAGLELLSEGVAQLYPRHGPERPTLAGFDVANLPRGLCERCAAERPEAAQPGLAARDYRDLLVLNDPTAPLPALDAKHAAAHRRLVARFVRHHSGEADRFPALELWERHSWAPLSPPQPVAS